MDIFVSGAPPNCTERKLRETVQPCLKRVGIVTFNCDKFKNKPLALITVLDETAASEFIARHGSSEPRTRPQEPIVLSGRLLNFKPGKEQPKTLLLRALQKQAADRQVWEASHLNQHQELSLPARNTHTFDVDKLQCGIWDYRDGNLVFVPIYQDARRGSLVLGRKNMIIVLLGNKLSLGDVHIRIPYRMVDSIVSGDHQNPSITIALEHPPAFHSLDNCNKKDDVGVNFQNSGLLDSLLANLSLNNSIGAQESEKRDRICSLDPHHESSAGNCFVYRVFLADTSKLDSVAGYLKSTPGSPGCIRWPTSKGTPYRDWQQEFRDLIWSLTDTEHYGFMPWSVKFQIERLAQNGYLAPRKILALLPQISELLRHHRTEKIVEGIRHWSRHAPFPGPETDPSFYNPGNIITSIKIAANRFRLSGSAYQLVKKHPHLGLVHKVTITPSGIYFDGPELETKNRVLRKYPDHIDYFIRVTFADENMEKLYKEAGATLEKVYDRFSGILNKNITIADRTFVFLGFSHSSLRSQQCWFMAPFSHGKSLINAPQVIKDLGDFTHFRSPAKCAARIGQAFSDATETVPIWSEDSIQQIADVERNGRCFTDGVGIISEQLLSRVWLQFTRTRKMHATLLQVRFQGAKGMLMLDDTLQGEQLCLRPSMIKFEGSKDMNLEITGAAFRRLPMFLNRQFIKILEDLGVPTSSFMKLQTDAVAKLHRLVESPINAAQFLRTNYIGTDSNMPDLIEALHDIDLHFRDDPFLSDLVELAALGQLRDIKHRGRIPLENSHTLHGIADTTGVLKEGQVYVAFRTQEGNRTVLNGDVLITRAPALHPGDIQYARAVAVPEGSLLANLHNCVVFSIQGKRDLPSQLSGGDLDGDLYNVICEPGLWPTSLEDPADYPRVDPVDIGRPVEISDITQFFIEFMKTDQLGRINQLHLHMADLRESGTRDKDCIKLAEAASTAVDFSKTGIAMDMSELPRLIAKEAKLRPDFMAPSPRLVLDSGSGLQLADETDFSEEVDPTSHLEPDFKAMQYYESEKALGQLYRAIDETKFLLDLQNHQHPTPNKPTHDSLMQILWKHVEKQTRGVQWIHHRKLAQEVMENYEENLHDAMYQFSPHRRMPLGELEVFTGTILGRYGGIASKRTREKSLDMKSHFGRIVTYTIDWILRGDGDKADYYVSDPADPNGLAASHLQSVDAEGYVHTGTSDGEELPRAIACLAVAMEDEAKNAQKEKRRRKKVVSFKYVAAAVCLREMAAAFRARRHLPLFPKAVSRSAAS